MEEALRRAKKAGREPGCYFGGITLRSGRRGFAVYRDGKVVAQFTAIGTAAKDSAVSHYGPGRKDLSSIGKVK